MPAAEKPAWGNAEISRGGPGSVLAGSDSAVILYTQFPAHFAGIASPEKVRQHVKGLSPQGTRQYFHQWILPGIDIPEQAVVQSKRSSVYLGMAALACLGAIGSILAGVGVAGIVGGGEHVRKTPGSVTWGIEARASRKCLKQRKPIPRLRHRASMVARMHFPQHIDELRRFELGPGSRAG